ncbi:cyclic lactone autoinducer peptide [Clostridium baratii]
MMKKLNSKLLMGIATLATVFAGVMATSACYWCAYQPEEPKSLREE